MLFWQEQSDQVFLVGKKPTHNTTVWSNGSENHISFLGWGVIKPYVVRYIYNQSPKSRRFAMLQQWPTPHPSAALRWMITVQFPVYFLHFNLKYCHPCQFFLKGSLTRKAVWILHAWNKKIHQNTKWKK